MKIDFLYQTYDACANETSWAGMFGLVSTLLIIAVTIGFVTWLNFRNK